MTTRDDYQKLVLRGEPVGYWPLRANAEDCSGLANHGISHGSPEFIHDESGGWVRLDGASFIEIRSQPLFSQPVSGMGLTVEVWMQTHSLHYPSPEKYIHWLGKGEPGQQEWAFRLYSDHGKEPSRLSAYIWNKEGHLGAGAHLKHRINCNQWMHVVACFEPGSATNPDRGVLIYKNSEFQQGPPAAPTLYEHSPWWSIYPTAAKAPLRFGTRNQLYNGLVGGLAEIAIYPRVLSEPEIKDRYHAGSVFFIHD